MILLIKTFMSLYFPARITIFNIPQNREILQHLISTRFAQRMCSPGIGFRPTNLQYVVMTQVNSIPPERPDATVLLA
jgi:hypothetical protein